MARSTHVSAPPAPTPTPAPENLKHLEGNDVLPIVEGEGMPVVPPISAPAEAVDGTVPVGQGAGNLMPDKEDVPSPSPSPSPAPSPSPIGNGVENAPDLDADRALRDADMAEEAFASLKDEPFDPASNLGDWDGDGKAGGSAPAPVEDKKAVDKTNAELGEEVAIAHAQNDGWKPKREDVQKVLNERGDGKLPNGKAIDDEFWTAYDQAFDREVQQLAADGLSDEDRLRRVEKTLGLLSPRQ